MAGNKAKSHEPAASSPSQFLKSGQEIEKVEGQVEDFLPCHAGPYPSHADLRCLPVPLTPSPPLPSSGTARQLLSPIPQQC